MLNNLKIILMRFWMNIYTESTAEDQNRSLVFSSLFSIFFLYFLSFYCDHARHESISHFIWLTLLPLNPYKTLASYFPPLFFWLDPLSPSTRNHHHPLSLTWRADTTLVLSFIKIPSTRMTRPCSWPPLTFPCVASSRSW
jgi:hypothetical protein